MALDRTRQAGRDPAENQPQRRDPRRSRTAAPFPADATSFETRGFDVRLRHAWQGAVQAPVGGRKVEITPYAGVVYGDAGPGAEAGASVSLSDKVADRIDDLGLSDGRRFGDTGRWYLYAAASGRSVGLNMLRDEDGLRRAGWSVDGASALVSDAQVGVAWRRGAVQASVGYLHREIEPEHPIMGLQTEADDLVALSFSVKPR
ncbi:MAG TPA: hypothetical protein VF122_04665 [Caulobacteraceae bacterium]